MSVMPPTQSAVGARARVHPVGHPCGSELRKQLQPFVMLSMLRSCDFRKHKGTVKTKVARIYDI